MKKIKLLLLIVLIIVIGTIKVNAQTIEDGDYIISSKIDPTKVIDLSGGNIGNGSNIQLFSYNDSAAQIWNIKYNSESDYYTITSSKDNNYSFDIAGGNLKNSSNIQLYKSNK